MIESTLSGQFAGARSTDSSEDSSRRRGAHAKQPRFLIRPVVCPALWLPCWLLCSILISSCGCSRSTDRTTDSSAESSIDRRGELAEPSTDVRLPTDEEWQTWMERKLATGSDRLAIDEYQIGRAQLRQLPQLEQLLILQIDQGEVTDAEIEWLPGGLQLEHLRLVHSPLTSQGAEKVCRRYPQLKFLNLPNSLIDDQGLQAIAQLEQLELLRLGSPNLSDAGIEHLRRHPTLRFVHLIDAPLTETGLIDLASIENLESLYLDGVRLPQTAWRKWFELRPDVHVHLDQLHHASDPNRHQHE